MSTRREFIKQLSVAAGVSAAVMGLGLAPGKLLAASARDWFMPDEGDRHERAFIAFGAQDAIWEDFTADVQAALGRIARTIAVYEPVTVLCRSGERSLAEEYCGTRNVTYVTAALDDIWMRDIGANFVINDKGGLGAVDFNFNGWGDKQRHSKDAKIAARVAADAQATYLRSELVGEGGGIEVDGHGTGIMTESSWINSNRNPGWSKADVEAELKERLGLRKIIWLPGIKGKDITDAHVDFYARFIKPGVVIANLDSDPESYDHQVTLAHLEILKKATDADGRPLQIHTMSPPLKPRKSKFNQNNPDFAAGYINYFVINGAIIAPEFGDKEADVEAELKERLGLRKIIWLPGIKGKDITDAHVDFYARFIKPGVVIANLDNDPESYDHQVTLAHLEILRKATDADGRPLHIHTISPPLKPRKSKFNQNNPDFAAGYINYFVINGAIIAPEFGDKEADKKAYDLLSKLYPERKVELLNIDAIAAGGGGIHCVTSHQPQA